MAPSTKKHFRKLSAVLAFDAERWAATNVNAPRNRAHYHRKAHCQRKHVAANVSYEKLFLARGRA